MTEGFLSPINEYLDFAQNRFLEKEFMMYLKHGGALLFNKLYVNSIDKTIKLYEKFVNTTIFRRYCIERQKSLRIKVY